MKHFIALATISLVIGTLYAFPQGIPDECPDSSELSNSVETMEKELESDDSVHVEGPKQLRRRPEDCPPCPRIYLPVCGSDGTEIREFSNDCMMEFANCIEYRAFTLLKSGTCD